MIKIAWNFKIAFFLPQNCKNCSAAEGSAHRPLSVIRLGCISLFSTQPKLDNFCAKMFTFGSSSSPLIKILVERLVACTKQIAQADANRFADETRQETLSAFICLFLYIFFFLHCPLFREGCKGSSSRLSRHTSLSFITSIISLEQSPKQFHPRSLM